MMLVDIIATVAVAAGLLLVMKDVAKFYMNNFAGLVEPLPLDAFTKR